MVTESERLSDSRPDKSPLPIILFLAMFPVYAVGVCIGFDIRISGFFALLTSRDGDPFRIAAVLGLVPLLVPLVLGLCAIRTIATGTRRTAGIVWYLMCVALCVFVGVFIVPVILFSIP